MERRQFRDSGGALCTPSRPSAAHYHLKLVCVRTADTSFIQVPLEIKSTLTSVHRHYLQVD